MHAKWVALAPKDGQTQQDLRKRMRAQWNVSVQEEDASKENTADQPRSRNGSAEQAAPQDAEPLMAKPVVESNWDNGINNIEGVPAPLEQVSGVAC